MRYFVIGLVGILLLAGGVVAQPADGDMIVGQFRDPNVANSYGPGSILGVNTTTGAIYTIAASHTTAGTILMGPNWIEMASDNTNFIVGSIPAGATATAVGNGLWLHSVSPSGAVLRTLMQDATASVGYINGFDLDFDGTWILGAAREVHAFNENTLIHTTLFSTVSPAGTINAVKLDPALPRGNINILSFATDSATTPNLIEADRQGVISTIATGGPYYGSAVGIDYQTGDYICSGFGIGALNGSGGEYIRVTKSGVVTTLNYPSNSVRIFRANGLFIDQQHMGWVLAYDLTGVTVPVPTSLQASLVCSLFKMGLDGTFVTMYRYGSTLTRTTFAPAGVTQYGSRRIVCNGSGVPGTAVQIRMSSRKPSDAGRTYQCAVSLGYTKGIKFANGEYLDLTFDNWFVLSVYGVLPGVFQNFSGVLDKLGNNTLPIAVNIPAGLPRNLNLTFYVSGVVVDPKAPGGVTSVANTHWFTVN